MKSLLLCLALCAACHPPKKGLQLSSPYIASNSASKGQHIPGRIECELYDIGGEGLSYHDNDSVNNGSGKLNPANGTFLNEFRMKEAVDISYTKDKEIDNNPFNKVEPVIGSLYVGWTEPGEWTKYWVNVEQTGQYTADLMYTSNRGGRIRIDIDGRSYGNIDVPSTFDARDTIAWRQWHHWNKLVDMINIRLVRGQHQLTLHTIEQGNMNYDYIEFRKK